jgi:hypothetical protein
MADDGHFHNLKRGGIPRQLAEGLSARVFPGEHLMLSVVEITAGARCRTSGPWSSTSSRHPERNTGKQGPVTSSNCCT